MSNNQIIAIGNSELSKRDVQTLKETIARDLNESQFNLFLAMCQRTGANPIVNEIHPTVYKGQMTVQFGYDFYIRKAKESEGYLGYDVQLIHENDEFKVARKTDDKGRSYMEVEKHEVTFPRGKVVGGYAVAYREGVTPFMVLMEASEVEHFKKSQIGMQKTMWTNYFEDMFKKHILKRALKSQFGLEFDEIPIQTDSTNIPEYQPAERRERKDITPNEPFQQETPQYVPQQEPPQEQQQDPMEKARAEMKEKFIKLGITTKEAMAEYIEKHAKPKGPQPTLAEMQGLLQLMDMHIEMQQHQASDELE